MGSHTKTNICNNLAFHVLENFKEEGPEWWSKLRLKPVAQIKNIDNIVVLMVYT